MRNDLAIALLLTGLSLSPAAADVVAAVDVPAMLKASQLVVVGRVGGARIEPDTQKSITESFYLSVDRVLHGAGANPSRRLFVKLDVARPLADRQYGIFFLRRTAAGGAYEAADARHPALAASPARLTTPAATSTALGRIADELGRVLTTSPATLTNPLTGLQGLPAGTPLEQANAIYFETAEALKTIPYEASGSTLRAALESDQPAVRLWALNCLLAIWGPGNHEAEKLSALESLRAILMAPKPELKFAVSKLSRSMEGRITSPEAAPMLAALLGSNEPAVREAATLLLGKLGTKVVIAPLAKHALDDPVQRVRYLAVVGLADATRVKPAPTLAAFNANEDQILRFWRNWAASYRR